MQFPDHRWPPAVQESRFLPVHFRRRVRPRRPRQSLSNSIKWGNSRYYRTPGLKLPNYTQTNGHDDGDDGEEAHVHYDAVVNRVSTMNRRSRADPRRHFRRVCFDSKFPVKLVTGTGLFVRSRKLPSPLVSRLRIFRAVRREHAVLSAPLARRNLSWGKLELDEGKCLLENLSPFVAFKSPSRANSLLGTMYVFFNYAQKIL